MESVDEMELDKKNRRIALISTACLNIVVFLVLLLLTAWRTPEPPGPGMGIELNFGLDDQGGGEIQPTEPVGAKPEDQKEQESPTPPQPSPQKIEDAENKQLLSDEESPVVVNKEKESEKKEPAKTVKNPEKAAPKRPEEEPQKADPNALYNPNKNSGDKTGKAGSHGDDPGKTGDKGHPEGKLDKNALYGNPGSGGAGSGGSGGSSLDLAGWAWDKKPSPKVPDAEMGGIVKFQIKVDANGDIISIVTLERSVSPETERICKQAVQDLTFSKTGVKVPEISTGTITFVVRSR